MEAEGILTLLLLPSGCPLCPNISKSVTYKLPLLCTSRIHCGALNASDSGMDRKFAGERWCVPNADKLDTQQGLPE